MPSWKRARSAGCGDGTYALGDIEDVRARAEAVAGTVSHLSAAISHGWKVKQPPDRPTITLPRNRSLPEDESLRGASGRTSARCRPPRRHPAGPRRSSAARGRTTSTSRCASPTPPCGTASVTREQLLRGGAAQPAGPGARRRWRWSGQPTVARPTRSSRAPARSAATCRGWPCGRRSASVGSGGSTSPISAWASSSSASRSSSTAMPRRCKRDVRPLHVVCATGAGGRPVHLERGDVRARLLPSGAPGRGRPPTPAGSSAHVVSQQA